MIDVWFRCVWLYRFYCVWCVVIDYWLCVIGLEVLWLVRVFLVALCVVVVRFFGVCAFVVVLVALGILVLTLFCYRWVLVLWLCCWVCSDVVIVLLLFVCTSCFVVVCSVVLCS